MQLRTARHLSTDLRLVSSRSVVQMTVRAACVDVLLPPSAVIGAGLSGAVFASDSTTVFFLFFFLSTPLSQHFGQVDNSFSVIVVGQIKCKRPPPGVDKRQEKFRGMWRRLLEGVCAREQRLANIWSSICLSVLVPRLEFYN